MLSYSAPTNGQVTPGTIDNLATIIARLQLQSGLVVNLSDFCYSYKLVRDDDQDLSHKALVKANEAIFERDASKGRTMTWIPTKCRIQLVGPCEKSILCKSG